MPSCAACGNTENIRACKSCGNTFYCGKVCQKKDWRRHRVDCKKHPFPSSAPSNFMKAFKMAAETMARTVETPTRDLVTIHMEMLNSIQKQQAKIATQGLSVMHMNFQTSQKPASAFPVPPDISKCTPVSISEMTIGTTHKGRVLRGKVLVPPCRLTSTQSVLEDITGSMVNISVYNVMESEGAHLLAKGSILAILEPFYKIARDGSRNVRVDNPHEVIKIKTLGPDTAEGWHDEGNFHFKRGEFSAAERCYTRALALLPGADLQVICLQNAAVAASKQQKHTTTIAWAGVALCLGNTPKASALLENAISASEQTFQTTAESVSFAADPIIASHSQTRSTSSSNTQRSGQENDSKAQKKAEKHKAEGTRLFRACDYETAHAMYIMGAISLVSDRGTKLLSNRAACHLNLENAAQATFDATAVLCLAPCPQHLLKAHVRRVTALLDLGNLEAAESACDIASVDCTNAPQIKALKQRIRLARKAVKVAKLARPPKEDPSLSLHELMKNQYASAESTQMLNMLLSIPGFQGNKMLKLTGGVKWIRDDIGKYHEEMAQLGRWPRGCDEAACTKMLSEAYNLEISNLHEVLLVSNDESFKKLFPTSDQIMKRLMGMSKERFEWWDTASPGDVRERDRQPYNANIVHNFTNAANHKEILTMGTVHVAIGFVDLGVLQHAEIVDNGNSKQRGLPLRWIGYEACAFNVAKTLVIAEMLCNCEKGKITAKDVMQVWYSSTWSHSAQNAFRKALSGVLEKCKYNPEVTAFLAHWQIHNVSLKAAREAWLCACDPGELSGIGNWARQRDRLAVCEYKLTGELAGGGPNGSILMFSHPPAFKTKRESQESALTTLPFWALSKEHAKAQANVDVVATATTMILKGVQRLADAVLAGRIVIEVHHAIIKPDSPVIKEITALRPWTVSWSNVCDYITNSEFHQMARRLSGPKGEDTLHFAYSMNWLAEVKGVSLVDYPDPNLRKELIAGGRQVVREMYKLAGKDMLLFPPTDNPLNIGDFACAAVYYKNWAHWFFKQGCVPLTQVGRIEPSLYDPLSPRAMLISMTWTYDSAVKFSEKAVTEFYD